MRVGDRLYTFHDTGAMGAQIVYYTVRKINRVTVELESEYGDRRKVTKEFAETLHKDRCA